MRVTFLGSSAALADPDRAQSAVLITLDSGRKYLFDCGEGATRQMMRANVNPAEVGTVFLTHLHLDHIIGLPYHILMGWIFSRPDAPEVYGPKGTADFVKHSFEGGAYDVDIRARGAYPMRQKNIEAVRPKVSEKGAGVWYDDGELKVTAFPVNHIPEEICECYGFRIEAEGKVVAITSDTAPCPNIAVLGKDADLLIHECTFPQSFIDYRASTGVGTFNHTTPTQVGEVAAECGAKALVATHFGHFDTVSPAMKQAAGAHMPVDLCGPHLLDEVADDIRKTYSGPLYLAHDLMRIDL
ncbi:MBL fold metallo-hydrolase [Oceanibium sediminis]|uniref:MBL fold metallo-hydrolase n=1 Tax=Oceanibium sediminis TaxID=2026339 RepID=UPI000DD37C9E|nr:ribonuclease Z [Oceanibium sediminis]